MTLPIVCFSSCSVMKIRKKSIQMILHYVVTFVSLLSEADAETEPENCESVLSLCVSPNPTTPFPSSVTHHRLQVMFMSQFSESDIVCKREND